MRTALDTGMATFARSQHGRHATAAKGDFGSLLDAEPAPAPLAQDDVKASDATVVPKADRAAPASANGPAADASLEGDIGPPGKAALPPSMASQDATAAPAVSGGRPSGWSADLGAEGLSTPASDGGIVGSRSFDRPAHAAVPTAQATSRLQPSHDFRQATPVTSTTASDTPAEDGRIAPDSHHDATSISRQVNPADRRLSAYTPSNARPVEMSDPRRDDRKQVIRHAETASAPHTETMNAPPARVAKATEQTPPSPAKPIPSTELPDRASLPEPFMQAARSEVEIPRKVDDTGATGFPPALTPPAATAPPVWQAPPQSGPGPDEGALPNRLPHAAQAPRGTDNVELPQLRNVHAGTTLPVRSIQGSDNGAAPASGRAQAGSSPDPSATEPAPFLDTMVNAGPTSPAAWPRQGSTREPEAGDDDRLRIEPRAVFAPIPIEPSNPPAPGAELTAAAPATGTATEPSNQTASPGGVVPSTPAPEGPGRPATAPMAVARTPRVREAPTHAEVPVEPRSAPAPYAGLSATKNRADVAPRTAEPVAANLRTDAAPAPAASSSGFASASRVEPATMAPQQPGDIPRAAIADLQHDGAGPIRAVPLPVEADKPASAKTGIGEPDRHPPPAIATPPRTQPTPFPASTTAEAPAADRDPVPGDRASAASPAVAPQPPEAPAAPRMISASAGGPSQASATGMDRPRKDTPATTSVERDDVPVVKDGAERLQVRVATTFPPSPAAAPQPQEVTTPPAAPRLASASAGEPSLASATGMDRPRHGTPATVDRNVPILKDGAERPQANIVTTPAAPSSPTEPSDPGKTVEDTSNFAAQVTVAAAKYAVPASRRDPAEPAKPALAVISPGLFFADRMLAPPSPADALASMIATEPSWRPADVAATTQSSIVRPQTLQIQLNPDHLGTVTATLTLSGTQLVVELAATTREAHERLKGEEQTIEKAIRGLGYDVGQVSITQSLIAPNTAARPEAAAAMPQSAQRDQASGGGAMSSGDGQPRDPRGGRNGNDGSGAYPGSSPRDPDHRRRGVYI